MSKTRLARGIAAGRKQRRGIGTVGKRDFSVIANAVARRDEQGPVRRRSRSTARAASSAQAGTTSTSPGTGIALSRLRRPPARPIWKQLDVMIVAPVVPRLGRVACAR